MLLSGREIRGGLYKKEVRNLYKVIGMLLSGREIRGGLYKKKCRKFIQAKM
jgi:hypothetical protein